MIGAYAIGGRAGEGRRPVEKPVDCRWLEVKARGAWYTCTRQGRDVAPGRHCGKERCGECETEEEYEVRLTLNAERGMLNQGKGNGGQAILPAPQQPEEIEIPQRGSVKWDRPANETIEGGPVNETLDQWGARMMREGQSLSWVAREIGCSTSTVGWHFNKRAKAPQQGDQDGRGPKLRKGPQQGDQDGRGPKLRNGQRRDAVDWDGDAREVLGEKAPEGCEGLTLRELGRKLRAEGMTWDVMPKALGLAIGSSAVQKACGGPHPGDRRRSPSAPSPAPRKQRADLGEGEKGPPAASLEGPNAQHPALSDSRAPTREQPEIAGVARSPYPTLAGTALAAAFIGEAGLDAEFGRWVRTGEVRDGGQAGLPAPDRGVVGGAECEASGPVGEGEGQRGMNPRPTTAGGG